MRQRELTNAQMTVLAAKVGGELLKHCGRKKFYSMAMVESAAGKLAITADCMGWAFAMFTSASEFEEICARLGEDWDYQNMRATIRTATNLYAPPPPVRTRADSEDFHFTQSDVDIVLNVLNSFDWN
jgi:hypothetical protein